MTTEDMTAIPFVQTEEKQLVRGRWIDRDDVLEKRPVAVVNAVFGHARNVGIGDTLRIGIPIPQAVPRVLFIRANGSSFDDYLHVSPPGEDFEMVLELEVVGLYRYSGRATELNSEFRRSFTTFVYIPNSLIPEDFSYEYAWIGNDSHIQDATPGVDFQYQSWYSFVLTDTRVEDDFLMENEEALAALGIHVGFIPTNADEFWQSAWGILQGVTFNFMTFTLLTIMILLLIGFLYMRQSRKDFAILRALGLPRKRVIKQYVGTLFLYGFPSALLGGVGGGMFALQQVGNILNPLGEVEPYAEIVSTVEIYWLFAFGMIAFFFLLLTVVFWGIRIGSRSVLELLQGNVVKIRG
jgi:ABC-type antimicrobial peptide transport system permease subunit